LRLHAILGFSALLFAGCVAEPVQIGIPAELIGTVSDPVTTGWYKDFCEAGKLTASLPECVQVGGEIYKVAFLDARTPDGKWISNKIVIGFPAHALPRTYRRESRIHLVKSPDDFRVATGIEYLVTDWN
jgi:hypothetical protein